MKLWRGGRLATLAGDSGWGLIPDGALLVDCGGVLTALNSAEVSLRMTA